MGHFLHQNHCWQAVRCQKECFSAPKVATGGVWCSNWAFSAPESLLAGSLVPKRVFFCAKSCNGWSLVLKLGISCTGSVGECGGECSSVPKRGHCCAGIPRGRAPAFFAPFFSLFLQNGQYRIVYWTEEDDGAAIVAEIPV